MLCINTIEDTLSRYILLAKTKSGLEGINLRSELPFEVKLSEMREVKYFCQTCLRLLKKGKDLCGESTAVSTKTLRKLTDC